MPPHVLLVDEKPEPLRRLLDGLDARIHCARSVEEALREVLRREHAAVLLHVRSQGIDGFATAAAIRSLERRHRVPILLLSDAGERRALRRDPHSEVLRRALAPALLRARLAAHLKSGPGS